MWYGFSSLDFLEKATLATESLSRVSEWEYRQIMKRKKGLSRDENF